ncbi:MAG: nucleotide sugar dehydrogenase [Oscillospiraceae bacterium]|jgi:UDP-N-acetyl-D-glucosamine dehydrogenase|nr:nucleotide sugar dehydrogenase [Oscillospiraceae bacterium]
MKEILIKKIKEKKINVVIVGLGYVGLPLAVEFAKSGFKTVGIDIEEKKVNMVNSAKNYIFDISQNDLNLVISSNFLKATTDFCFIENADFIAICVPTPLDVHQQPNLSYVKESSKSVASFLKKNTMIVLESTTYPGTTEKILLPLFESISSLKCGKDFYLGFSPERIDPGNPLYKTKNTPKVVGAVGKDALETISLMYENVLNGSIYKVSSPKVAEMEKILENTYRHINVGLVNEIAILCNKMNINVWEVIEAAQTKPYGFNSFYPGPGLGGHCVPLDPYYLSWKAREYYFHTSMIEASAAINDSMPDYCVNRICKILNKFKKSLNGSKILVLGVAYKQNVDDCRESPAIRVVDGLKKHGASVDFYDPFVRKYKHFNKTYTSIETLNADIVKVYDIIVATTAHTNIDYEMIAKNSKIIFDTRNAFEKVENRNNIELL